MPFQENVYQDLVHQTVDKETRRHHHVYFKKKQLSYPVSWKFIEITAISFGALIM